MGVAGGLTKPRVFAWRAEGAGLLMKGPCTCLDSRGGWGYGQVGEDVHTHLESGCGQVDEDPHACLQSGGHLERLTKDPCTCLRSGGWQWGMWG